ncbi:GNAT family N-acetyltransferase [Gracilibacillus caseinilyticus]|uniref:GNAT family N-acetyltransferase n=1 Tax=Gracilibacillus caseinilyticus TaxID=2932256 RepID=A0ABY4EZH3_9BACI|nr:GNAT family protein [Gracilibacillus caseinilyticus]UOQ49808.1 GNAT family N-acetyltransferase [Gracilibacillus caseinilyticus]
MYIETDRLIIKKFEECDADEVFTIYNDEHTCQYLLHERWTNENKHAHFQKKLANHTLTQNNSISLAVLYRSQVIGDLSVWYTGMKDTVEVGYTFLRTIGGQGFATESVKALMSYLFQEYGVHRVQATLDARNEASIKLCERVGMRKEAHFIQNFWNKAEWTDSIVFGMLASDLP